jgi:Arc/MetJ family transcription regulator
MRTTVNIDSAAFDEAEKLFQTNSVSETVNMALREVVMVNRRMKLAERIRAGKMSTPTPAELKQLKRAKIGVGSLSSK